MTISTTINRKEYTGNGVNDTFAYTFWISADGDLKVYVDSVLQTITTHYTVTNAGEPSGGNVVFEAGFIPAASTSVVIWRDVPKTQGTDYVGGEKFSAETHETALDRLTVITQQIQDDMDRCIKLAKTVTDAGDVEMDVTATERASKFFGFDVDGNLSVAAALGTWQGKWATTTAYNVGDMVYDGDGGAETDNVYYCATSHTSGTWATDLAAAKWTLAIDIETIATDAAASAAAAAASAVDAQSSEDDAAADLVLTNADVVLTNADVVTTNADVVLTNADVVLTGLDVDATNADVVSTNADVVTTNADAATTTQDAIDTAADAVATAADLVETAADLVLTNADVVLTGLDVVATNADVVSTNADVVTTNADAATTTQDAIDTAADAVATAADAVATAADVILAAASEALAEEWAEKAEDSAITGSPGQYSALHWAAKAAADNPVNAIHDNIDGEIKLVTEKAAPVGADLLLIEDSEASDAKKRLQMSNLPAPAAATMLTAIKTVDGAGSGLDADLLDGAHASEIAGNSTVVKRNASGYVYCNYLNTSAGAQTAVPTAIWTELSSDGFHRKMTPEYLITHLEGAVKGWAHFDALGTFTVRDSYNVTSMTDQGVGQYRVTWATDFGSANYAFSGWASRVSNALIVCAYVDTAMYAGYIDFDVTNTAPSYVDTNQCGIMAIGAR